jgi:2-keto-4-pentenoate hydratase/2-oxohepta-3-ene-1,7-dioic acid hydratase in catechol pathway
VQFIGYDADGKTRVAALAGAGTAADLTSVDSFYEDPAGWAAKAGSAPANLAVADLVLRPPVRPAARILCVGLNYRAHAVEGGFAIPEYPTVFARWTPSLSVTGVPVPVPSGEPGLDWEGEMAAVIGAPLREASESEAEQALFGYAVFNDLTARRAQRRTSQWTVGKNADLSGPMGPIVTVDEVGDLTAGRRLVTRINGDVVQDTLTSDMIFTPAQVAAFLSRTLTLNPGDVIVTGTPSGVGHARTPERFLGPGEEVSVEIEGIGRISNPIVARESRSGW